MKEAFKEILEYANRTGEVSDESMENTPRRAADAFKYLLRGYDEPDFNFTVFDNKENYNQMVILKDIEFYSLCEHHVLPFYGKVHIAYIPDKKYCGISKLARVAEHFSRRLQVQERLTQQIGEYIKDKLDPKGVMVVMEGKHLCMMMRGIEKQNSVMKTSYIYGAFEEQEARNEFLKLIEG